jgi:5-formyltetrahydrofolate cyclo-ligase
MVPDKKQIRQEKRNQRRSLSRAQQTRASEQLARTISSRSFFLRSKHLAFYLPNDGEIDPGFLLSLARAAGKDLYLPVLAPMVENRLIFLPYSDSDKLAHNRFGIPEPLLARNKPFPAWALDVVFMPLVAFDNAGNRLGMGGGFYDRTFARLHDGKGRRPLLIGLAHSLQAVDHLPEEPWDIPLDAIATEQSFTTFRQLH